jgi:predicted HAD superfamily Cof-like phosphohydrolase
MSKERIDELLGRNTELVLKLRTVDRKQMVREFFVIAGQPLPERPCVPSDDTVRFRLRLVAEEFFELLKASFGPDDQANLVSRERDVLYAIEIATITIDFPEFIDATIDLDYVVEGVRVSFGVNATPLWTEVHQKNMAKAGGPRRASDGKQLKPEGWTPPDIAGLLKAQGWVSP